MGIPLTTRQNKHAPSVGVESSLFALMSLGEAFACRVSAQQAQFYEAHGETRFVRCLRHQSKQERMHARVFAVAAGSQGVDRDAITTFSALERHVLAELDNGRVEASVLGLQIFIEALGESILDDTLSLVGDSSPRWRDTLLCIRRQEGSHHGLGKALLKQKIRAGDCSLDSEDHVLALCHDIVEQTASRFDLPGETADRYQERLFQESRFLKSL